MLDRSATDLEVKFIALDFSRQATTCPLVLYDDCQTTAVNQDSDNPIMIQKLCGPAPLHIPNRQFWFTHLPTFRPHRL